MGQSLNPRKIDQSYILFCPVRRQTCPGAPLARQPTEAQTLSTGPAQEEQGEQEEGLHPGGGQGGAGAAVGGGASNSWRTVLDLILTLGLSWVFLNIFFSLSVSDVLLTKLQFFS